jgi:hypothetical protein
VARIEKRDKTTLLFCPIRTNIAFPKGKSAKDHYFSRRFDAAKLTFRATSASRTALYFVRFNEVVARTLLSLRPKASQTLPTAVGNIMRRRYFQSAISCAPTVGDTQLPM